MRIPSQVTQRRGGGFDATMTPMIDVVFLLLVFFLWTASFQIIEHVLPSRLILAAGSGAPEQTPPELEDFDRVVVRLLWDGGPVWLVNDAPRGSLAEVEAMLAALAAIKRDAPVIVDPDAVVPLGHVIDVYDAARRAGFLQIQFAASPAA